MKYWILNCLVFFTLFFLQKEFIVKSLNASSLQSSNRVSLLVGKKMVSLHELYQRLRLSAFSAGFKDTQEHLKMLQPNVIRMMIDEAIQIQAAESVGISVGPQEIEEGIVELETVNKMSKGSVKKFLAANKIPLGVLENQIRANLSWLKYIRAYYQGSVRISDEMIDQHIKRHEREQQEPHYRVGEIVLYVDHPKKEEQVHKEAVQLAQLLQKGAPFPGIAYQFSQAPSRQQGGDLGWLTVKDLDPLLAEALQKTAVGQFSGPWRTASGYVLMALIQKEAKNSNHQKKLNREEIERALRGERLELLARKEIAQLRRQVFIEIRNTPF
ncbi:MAG: peptidylprolyl isomerase [Alphaproteobacteria bacterium]